MAVPESMDIAPRPALHTPYRLGPIPSLCWAWTARSWCVLSAIPSTTADRVRTRSSRPLRNRAKGPAAPFSSNSWSTPPLRCAGLVSVTPKRTTPPAQRQQAAPITNGMRGLLAARNPPARFARICAAPFVVWLARCVSTASLPGSVTKSATAVDSARL